MLSVLKWKLQMIAAAVTILSLLLAFNPYEPVAQASTVSAPVPKGPNNGATLNDFSATLQWELPGGTTQYHLSVVPQDGPAIDLIRNAENSFTIPRPPQWYGLLPDMTYTWKLRASDATRAIGAGDSSWGDWSASRTFRTPKVSSQAIKLIEPSNGSAVSTTVPTLEWTSGDSNIWYYEVQISKDSSFNTDPLSASAPVYWESRHGGLTVSPTYKVPDSQPLEPSSTYYWRVRPRIQGDGSPVEWTAYSTFSTSGTSGTRWVTLEDNGKTIDLLVGDMLRVDLGTNYEWRVTVEDETVLTPLYTMGSWAMPLFYRANSPGETRLSAVGELPCHRAQPPCLAPSLFFEVQVIVHNDMVVVKAPIDGANIRIAGSHPAQYFADVDSGLPNGCIRFYGYNVSRKVEDTINIDVLNLAPADQRVACTMVYGTVHSNIALGSDFTKGRTYTVWVNEVKLTFVAQ